MITPYLAAACFGSFRRSFFLLSLLTLFAICPRGSLAQSNDTLTCNSIYVEQFPGVFASGTISQPINLTNPPNGTNTAFSLRLPFGTAFHLDSTNFILAKGQSRQLTIRYVPKDTNAHIDTLIVTGNLDTTCKVLIVLTAPALKPTADSAVFVLGASTPNVIAIQTNSNSTSLTVSFENTSSSLFIVDSAYIDGVDSLSLSSQHRYPDTLNLNEQIEFTLTYQKTQPGFQQGYLIVAHGTPIVTEECVIEVQRLPNSAVQSSHSGSTYFRLYPNPSHGPVTIHSDGVVNPHVKVTDVLGRTLREESFSQDWTWDGASAYSEHNEPGTYFIELSGINERGQLVHEVRRVIIE